MHFELFKFDELTYYNQSNDTFGYNLDMSIWTWIALQYLTRLIDSTLGSHW